jgi:predicted lysophospholipase L1 biosynthesis ABC-type transport system permease subunit
MTGNNLWLALTNIKRKKFGSILFYSIAFFISQSLFFISISRHFIVISDLNEIRDFFSTIIVSVLVLSILLLVALTLLYMNSRRRELVILRIFGARKSEIMVVTCLEVLMLSLSGAGCGLACMLLLIKMNILYLPHFFQGMQRIDRVRLLGIAGQTVFLVVLIEVIVSIIMLSALLRNDISKLARGSS